MNKENVCCVKEVYNCTSEEVQEVQELFYNKIMMYQYVCRPIKESDIKVNIVDLLYINNEQGETRVCVRVKNPHWSSYIHILRLGKVNTSGEIVVYDFILGKN